MNYPVKKVFVTQEIGSNPKVYAQFGLKGHNGLDLRIYDENGVKALEGELYAPHDGKIIEATLDDDGYGYYYKIENEIEGSVLAHNKTLFFKVGDYVKEGQHIGTTDNTGFSTGSHLHWIYYRHPRDKSNGYGGAIDPRPYIKVAEVGMYTEEQMSAVRLERDKNWNLYQEQLKKVEELKNQLADSYTAQENLRKIIKELESNPITTPNELPVTWIPNGMAVTTEENGVKKTINYAVKQA